MKNSPGCSRSEQRAPQGPLIPYLAAFERLLRTEGYARPTIRIKVRLVRDFSSVETTQVYLTASLALKEKILAKTTPMLGARDATGLMISFWGS